MSVGWWVVFASCATGPSPESAARAGAAPAAAAAVATPRTVLAGVFTAAQADRGEQEFQQTCASCHSPNEFSGPVFQRIWTDRSVGELYHVISTMMPQTNPGSLSPREYTDILAFFLRRNGYPAGETELPPDPALLEQVIFQPAD